MNDEFDSTTAALLIKRYRRAEDLLDEGWFHRLTLGFALLDIMNRVGETKLRRIVFEFCPELSWAVASREMDLVIATGPWPRLPALPRLNQLDSLIFAWLTNRYRLAELFFYSGLVRRVEFGDRLLNLRIDGGETQLRRIVIESCPEIPWEDAQTAMNFARVVDREFLESCLPPFHGL